jgi:hypothetical protein
MNQPQAPMDKDTINFLREMGGRCEPFEERDRTLLIAIAGMLDDLGDWQLGDYVHMAQAYADYRFALQAIGGSAEALGFLPTIALPLFSDRDGDAFVTLLKDIHGLAHPGMARK